jgi:hypothetical protein
MSYGVALRNSVALGLGGIVALFSGYGPDQGQYNLETENGDNLVQEDGGLLLVE